MSRSGARALLCLAVLLWHLQLLQLVLPPPAKPGAPAPAGLQVRTIVAPRPPSPPADMVPVAVAATPEMAVPARAPVRAATPVSAAPVAPSLPATAATTATVAPTAIATSAEAHWPTYATRLPAAAELHYRLRRGDSVGSARLHWQPADGDYELRMELAWPGQAARGSTSRGLLDGDGLAPVRHAELQRAREVRAVNFQREAGRITFSGPQLAYAWRAGAQDRLSWWIQLPAIIEADTPALTRAGASVWLFVVGPRGDAEAWRFDVLAHEALQRPTGAVAQALHLRREPTRPYDTRVEVWLDPARQHLPVRAVFTTVPGGVPLQLELVASAAIDGLESEVAAPR